LYSNGDAWKDTSPRVFKSLTIHMWRIELASGTERVDSTARSGLGQRISTVIAN